MSTDYLVVGGSVAAQVLVARLREYEPNVSITLVVPNVAPTELSKRACPLKAKQPKPSQGSADPNAASVQEQSTVPLATSVHSPQWSQSGADDYNRWAKLVQDPRWSYESLQPYFQRIESELAHDHGSDDIRDWSANAKLSNLVRQVFLEDKQSASKRYGDYRVASRVSSEAYIAKTILSRASYPLEGIEIIRQPVKRLLFSRRIARGIELIDGQRVIARREVILASGAVLSAHLLLLSGIGPINELASLGMENIVDVPVGQNGHGHLAFVQRYEVSEPFEDSKRDIETISTLGMPVGEMITASTGHFLQESGSNTDSESDDEGEPSSATKNDHVQIYALYHSSSTVDMRYSEEPYLAVATVHVTPNLRGAVQLASTDPMDEPMVAYDYLESKTEQAIFRQGVRLATQLFEAPLARKSFRPVRAMAGLEPLRSTSSPDVIDRWIRECGLHVVSAGGTAAMGSVVDNNLKVIGTERLRVVDESVMPCPIAADYRAAACVIAEQAAVLIAMAWNHIDDCAPV